MQPPRQQAREAGMWPWIENSGSSGEWVQAGGVGLSVGLHIIESLRAERGLNSRARISLVLSPRLLYVLHCGECVVTGKGMETPETLSRDDS